MSEILMCDKCKDVFSKTGKAMTVELSFTRKGPYGIDYDHVLEKSYDLCGDCASDLLKEFEAPAALTAETTVRL